MFLIIGSRPSISNTTFGKSEPVNLLTFDPFFKVKWESMYKKGPYITLLIRSAALQCENNL